MPIVNRYFILHKPFNMVSQFVSMEDVRLLGDIDFKWPMGTHAVGRLDSHSEGLLILTTNKRVTKLLFQGAVPHKRTYLVRVKNIMSADTLQRLRDGVTIIIKGGAEYTTPPCEVHIVNAPPEFLAPHPEDGYVPHTWITISLYEGKFHQVRKMVQAVGHPCRRLIRISIEDIELNGLEAGCIREMDEEAFFKGLRIDYWA